MRADLLASAPDGFDEAIAAVDAFDQALVAGEDHFDSIAARHPELAAELYGLMTPEPDPEGTRDRDAEVRRAALASKVLLNVFDTGSGAVTAGQLARWQSDAGWLEAALGCQPGGLRGGRGGHGGRSGRPRGAASGPGTGRGSGPGVSPFGTDYSSCLSRHNLATSAPSAPPRTRHSSPEIAIGLTNVPYRSNASTSRPPIEPPVVSATSAQEPGRLPVQVSARRVHR
jgi:hypothetical protein